MIPKRIIYVWMGKNPYPKNILDNINSWKRYNPEYEFLEINEHNFDVNLYDFTRAAYSNDQWAFVSDVARIWAVNNYGGIYLDTDVEAIKNFDDLLIEPQFWAKEDVGMVNSGLIFGSEKNNKVLEEILEKYSKMEFKPDKMVENTTVHIVSNVLRNHGLKLNKKVNYLDNGAKVYSPEYFAPFHYWGGGRITDKTITVHKYGASWISNNKSKTKYFMHEIMYHLPMIGEIVRWGKRKMR
ncbi:glycosyltransferase family 32 protein [Limosilactobacillus mucosae]